MSAEKSWAYAGLTLGAAVSMTGNLLHSYVHPDGVPTDWSPPPGAVFGALLWPVALFIALEVLVNGQWGRHWGWLVMRVAAVGPVAVVAAVVSYQHLSGLLHSWHEDGFTARFGPVAVDGLMVVCSAALYRARTVGQDVVQPVGRDASPTLDEALLGWLDSTLDERLSNRLDDLAVQLRPTLDSTLDETLDKVRSEVLDSVRAELDSRAVQPAQSNVPSNGQSKAASNVERPAAARKSAPRKAATGRPERSDGYTEAVRRMCAAGVAKSTASHRAGKAEDSGTLGELLEQYPPVRVVGAAAGS